MKISELEKKVLDKLAEKIKQLSPDRQRGLMKELERRERYRKKGGGVTNGEVLDTSNGAGDCEDE